MRLPSLLSLVVLFGVGLSSTPAVEQEDIDKAIERGTAALRQRSGSWAQQNGIGATALVGLTLLECGAAADDKVVQAAAGAVRQDSVTMGNTYQLALSVLFLDRLGDPADVAIIESLVVRLLAGQKPTGGWLYNCPNFGEGEARRLTNHLKNSELVGRRTLPDKAPEKKRTPQDLPPEIKQQLALINRLAPTEPGSDSSNTQFATLALWVGRRHGLPVDVALGRVDARFRTCQNRDGGWGYMSGTTPGFHDISTATMTCAGLLGLVVGHGVVAERIKEKDPNARAGRDLSKDPNLQAGLAALWTTLGHPQVRKGQRPLGGPRAVVGAVGGKAFYFLWSLERVAVAMDLETLGGKDWYSWGAEILLANQQPEGTWRGEFGDIPDTCFALLFLRRANLAKDLTVNLRGKLKDPGEAVLKAGGEAVRSADKPLKPVIELSSKDKPDKTEPQPVVKEPAREPTREPTVSRENPKPSPLSESARLAQELVRTRVSEQEHAVERLRNARGVVNTEALATAIPQLDGEVKRKAREALASRLTRMKADTLGSYLKDEDSEIRRAAALACAMKDSKTLIPELLPLLNDPEPLVVRAAHLALKELTGQTFGPSREVWQAWLARQK